MRPSELGGEQVEGRQAVRELLAAGRRRAREILLAQGLEDAGILREIVELATAAQVPVRRVSRARLEGAARTDAPQGVLATAAPLPVADLATLAGRRRGPPVEAGRRQGPPFLLVLDGVLDPHNLGALLRTAEAAGATGAVLPRRRAAHVTPVVAKAAAGAIERVPIALVAGIAAALQELRSRGVWTVGLDPGGTTSVYDLTVATEPLALVLGSEGRGLGRLVAERCEVRARIPLAGSIGSLNVAAAAAISCFEVARRRAAG